MNLRDKLYYLRQYREYNRAGMVPNVTCDECDVPYMAKPGDDDEIILYCYQCFYEMTPGEYIINEMIKYVRKIEG